MSEPVKVLFGVLSTYERSGWHHPSITQFFADLPFQTGTAYRVVQVSNFIPAASGRNVFCKNSKDTDADWLAMIDNDMVIPANLLDTLKDAPADADIIVPAFYAWDQTKYKVTLCWGIEGDVPTPAIKELRPGFHELTKCGTGVVFIRPRVFEKLSYPYFFYQYNEDQGMCATEDIQFALKATAAGYKIYGNAAIKIGHMHSVDLLTLWKWLESVYVVDKNSAAVANSEAKDAESPSVQMAAQASPA